MTHYAIWRVARRPFRYPSCSKCTWEVYDMGAAGCLRCGAMHSCAMNSVDSKCPLEECSDHSRVCIITGQVIPEVRHAHEEFTDTVCWNDKQALPAEIDDEVYSIVYRILQGDRAKKYREMENTRQSRRFATALYKSLRQHKINGLVGLPCMCTCLADVMSTEKNMRFVSEASSCLVEQCAKQIVVCMLDLRSKGVKINSGLRIQNMACGLLYLLQTGLRYKKYTLLSCIEEISDCLPHENKLEFYFGISSKVICETENEIKLAFREHFFNRD